MNNIDKIRIGLKLDAQLNSQLTKDELINLTAQERNELRASVSKYLETIDSAIQSVLE